MPLTYWPPINGYLPYAGNRFLLGVAYPDDRDQLVHARPLQVPQVGIGVPKLRLPVNKRNITLQVSPSK
jgi:hypothetical protein